jgi:NADH-quinone oxidoreductase subunit N
MNPVNYFALLQLTLPEIIVALTALVALTIDLLAMRQSRLAIRWRVGVMIAFIGCAGAILLLLSRPQSASLYDGMLVVTPLTQLMQAVLIFLTIFTVLLTLNSTFTTHVGEYLGVILFATAAMMFLVSTQNLLMIFAALELLSLSLYVLTAFNKRSRQSAEAALKYFLFGGMSAAFLLFGISLLYGLSNSINLAGIAAAIQTQPLSPLLFVTILLMVTGFGFKVAAAPFHFWAPDVYQGGPTPSAAFIASSSKVASFYAFAVVMLIGLASAAGNSSWHHYLAGWVPVLTAVAALSMLLGNLAAIVQSSVRRLLAFSAIGHAGYILLGILAHSVPGLRALLYYVVTYALTTLGIFGVLAALEKNRVDQLSDFAGLYHRAPALSFCMLIFVLSLAGIPPLPGFFAKFFIFSSALAADAGNPGLFWLVILAIAMSAISLYYYLKVLKQIYVREPSTHTNSIEISRGIQTTVIVIALLVVLLGCFPDLLLGWIDGALHAMPQ